MKKKLSLLAVTLIGFLVFPSIAKAEASFRITCDPQFPERGSETNCVVNLENASEAISKVNIKVEVEDMKLNSFTADTSVWNVDSVPSSDGFTKLTSRSIGGGITSGNIGSISATVNQDAVECGKVCVTITYSYYGKEGENSDFINNKGTTTSCTQTTTTVPDDQTPTTPPETGSFASYAILAGGAAIAMATISVASKRTKFYRV